MARSRALLLAVIAAFAAAILTGAMGGAAGAQGTTGATGGATGGASLPAGLIAGRVTDSNRRPLANITVGAAPAGNDTVLTQTETDANGNYAVVVAPGSYDIAFNELDPVNDSYAFQVYGGPGPSQTDTCQVCGGAPQVVTNGAITGGIDAVLVPPQQTGTIRPLSGSTIKVLNNRITFRFGCHEDGIGCQGKGVLRIGTSTKDPVVSTVRLEAFQNHTMTLHFTVPSEVRARLAKAKHHALAAIVQLTTGPSSTTTKFTLVDRP